MAGVVLIFCLPFSGCDSIESGGGAGGSTAPPASAVLRVSPRQTYLLSSKDKAIDAPAVRLKDLGYGAGDRVCFRAEGHSLVGASVRASENRQPLVTSVFTVSPTLLGNSLRQCVPDAVEAGADVVTSPSAEDGFETDIDQDIDATNVCLTIPEKARYVFFSAFDTFYGDNGSVAGTDFGVRFST